MLEERVGAAGGSKQNYHCKVPTTHTDIRDIHQQRSSILNVGTLPESYPASRPTQGKKKKMKNVTRSRNMHLPFLSLLLFPDPY
jgi:hypothetical protein